MPNLLPNNLTYETVNELLVERLPALRSKYEELLKWWGDEERPGPHVVYGDLLNPCIEQATRSGDVATITKVFDLIETLSECPDARVRDLVSATVCDFIVSNEMVLKQARLAMKPLTRLRCEQVAQAKLPSR